MDSYNDGVIHIFMDAPVRTSFGAKVNEEQLMKICKLNFKQMSQRQKDLDFAQQNDFSLSTKVKTPFCPMIKKTTKYKAIIGTGLYDVSYFDTTKKNLFFYLEYIREVGDLSAVGS